MTPVISYQPFEALIISLRADALTKESDHIDYLLRKVAWTSGSELIGELGQKIKEISKEDISRLSAATIKNLKDGMDVVKLVWPDFPQT